MFQPPPGFDDAVFDGAQCARRGTIREVQVPEVGVVKARYPMPNALANLAMSENPKASAKSRQEHRVRFLRAHLDEGEHERLTVEMMRGELPFDTMERVTQAIATMGTARPTLPSSASR
ncbi:hypothetical protein SEA_ARGIE_35 [Mycobacterium phage Argie]|nr:hypothetical protein SEA_ARGIE_35 [Mycobacterium phage Argie]